MSVTVDANVLIYATNSGDPLHRPTRALLDSLAAGPELVYLFWPTVMAYLRIVTHPSILPSPLSLDDAATNIDRLLRRPHVRTSGEVDGFWDAFRGTAATDVRGNHVPDAHIVALMRQHGVRVIYTRDRDFRRYERIDVRDPAQGASDS